MSSLFSLHPRIDMQRILYQPLSVASLILHAASLASGGWDHCRETVRMWRSNLIWANAFLQRGFYMNFGKRVPSIELYKTLVCK